MLLLAASLLIADPAAASATTAPAPSVEAPKKKKEKTICKSFEDSASRLGNRVCKKESEWAGSKGNEAERGSSRSGMSAQPRD